MHNTIKKSLMWDITRKCNLNCIHCYNNGNVKLIKEMDLSSNYKYIIDAIKTIGVNHIHLLGGEPLLVKSLWDILYYANSKNILVTINTNGTLLNDEVIDRLIDANVSQITISLDGATCEDNDLIRGKGTFDLVISNIQKLTSKISMSNSNMIVQIATVITSKNIRNIHTLPRLLNKIGVKNLDILKLYKQGNAVEYYSELRVNNEAYLKALGILMIEAYKYKIALQLDCKPKVMELLGRKYGFNISVDSEFSRCSAGRKMIFMDSNGNVFPCGPFSYENAETDYKYEINILNPSSLKKIPQIEEMISDRITAYSYNKKKICKECQYNKNCCGCAICDLQHEELCEVALRIFN